MKSIKFKLLMFIGITVLIFSAALLYRTHSLVTSSVENLSRQELTLALDFNLAIREYVAETLRPLMFKLVAKGQFFPEAMSSSYVARNIFEKVRKEFPNLIIKYSSADPRNPMNRAGPGELNMIRYFNDHPRDTKWSGEIAMGGRKYLATFNARRMKKACLRCHGNPADAPYDLIKRYGPNASFYFTPGKVVGMDTVAVPSHTVNKMLFSKNIENIGFLATLIVLLSASLMFILKLVMTDRLSRINQHLLDIQWRNDDFEIKKIEIGGRDEIAALTESFNTLAQRLNHAYAELRTEIEERKQAQKALLESEEKYRKLFEMESDALVLVDFETMDILDANNAFIRLYGYSKEEICCMKSTDISADPDQTRKSIQNREERVPVRYHKKKDGRRFPVEITANAYEHRGKNVWIASIRDITERNIIEAKIKASLREKKLLLSEIHHRVKNNFEIISSLLSLSIMRCENQEIKDPLLSSKTRIQSMAMIHDQLYQSDRFDRINMTRQINEMAKHLSLLYGSDKKIRLEITSSEVYLPINHAIPCALIFNELITNSLKHAFIDSAQGKIEIFIHNSEDNRFLLRVKDDGIGIPEGAEIKPDSGLGIELVKNLVDGQLNGEIRFDNDNGTDISIKFTTETRG